VIIYSRHGKPRSIQGPWVKRRIKYLTLENLRMLANQQAGDDKKYFRLSHVFRLVKKELEASGIDFMDWQELINPKNKPLDAVLKELKKSKNGEEILWRSLFESSFDI